MKRLGIALLALGFLLTGCSTDWSAEVRFEVVRITESTELVPGTMTEPRVVLKIDQEQPSGAQQPIGNTGVDLDRYPGEPEAGDRVICTVRQYDDNAFDDVGLKTEVHSCRPA